MSVGALEKLINLLPGGYKIDKSCKNEISKMKKILEIHIQNINLGNYNNEKNNWLKEINNIEQPASFNKFMKIFMFYVFPQKVEGYKQILVDLISLLTNSGFEKKIIIEITEKTRNFFNFLAEKYAGNIEFTDGDG